MPTIFILMSSIQSLSGHSIWRSTRRMGPPALLTRMWMVLSWLTTSAAAALTDLMLLTSAGIPSASTPLSRRISSAVLSRASLLRARSTTFTPSFASARAMALPIPRVPPVTTAFRPLSPSSMVQGLSDRDAALVFLQPLIEVLELRVERTSRIDAARTDDLFFKVAVHLEHVSVFVSALEAEGAIVIRLDRIVLHGSDAETLRQLLADLVQRQVLTRNPDRFPDVPVASLEDAVRGLADVFGGDAGEFGVAHRECPAIDAVIAFLRREAEQVQVVPVERGDEPGGRET